MAERAPVVTSARRATSADVALIALLVFAACRQQTSDTTADATIDSATDSAAVARPGRRHDARNAPDARAGDAALRRDTLAALGDAAAAASVAASDPAANDTTPVEATPIELAALSAELTVPVSGVRAGDLLDTFSEARGTRRHNALDIPAPRGTPVLSAADGRLLKLYDSENGGLMIYAADASERFVLLYAHLDRYAEGLAEGAALRRGQVIGYVGTTGNAPPDVPHLHFGIARTRTVARWWSGTPIDPRPLLQDAVGPPTL